MTKKEKDDIEKERTEAIIDALKEFESEIEFAISVAMAIVNPYDDSMEDNDKLPPLAGVSYIMRERLKERIKKLKEQLNMEENK